MSEYGTAVAAVIALGIAVVGIFFIDLEQACSNAVGSDRCVEEVAES